MRPRRLYTSALQLWSFWPSAGWWSLSPSRDWKAIGRGLEFVSVCIRVGTDFCILHVLSKKYSPIGSLDLVGRLAHFALQYGVGIGTTFHQPAPQALVVHRADVTGALARLNERFLLLAVVAYPAVFLGEKRLALLGVRSGSLRFLGAAGPGRNRVDLACQEFAWIQDPQLFRRHRVP